MKFAHTMIRVKELDRSLDFFITKLGLIETRRYENPQGKFTLVFIATAPGEPEIELTYNWGMEDEYTHGRNFGHIAFVVDDIFATCERLMSLGVEILRPPRDGHLAFIKSPDNQSIELLQKGEPKKPISPWTEMENCGTW